MGYRYYMPPRAKLPFPAGALGLLLGLNTAHTLYTMPSYTQYYDYWVMMAAGFLLALVCFVTRRRRAELLLIPMGMFTIVACLSPNLTHWMEIVLFFLLLLLLLFRMPLWSRLLLRIAAALATGIGIFSVLVPMIQRIQHLAAAGHASSNFVIPFVIRTLGSDVLYLLAMVLLIFAMQPRIPPAWMDEQDGFDRIWE